MGNEMGHLGQKFGFQPVQKLHGRNVHPAHHSSQAFAFIAENRLTGSHEEFFVACRKFLD
jgi:hypothetical protein